MSCLGWKWQGQAGKRLVNNKVEDVTVVSETQCMNQCLLHDVCDSVNYRSSDSSCELNTHPAAGPSPGDLVDDNQWKYWSITSDLV